MLAVVLAHQGGWDEMLLVLGPIVVIVLLLRLARRRAGDATDKEEDTEAEADSTD
jgi:hypothetical protein